MGVSSSQETEAEALIKWKNSLTSPSPSLNNSWSLYNISNLCNWTGIQCNGGGTVSEINLPDMDLTDDNLFGGSSLSMDLSKLVGLRELRLRRNRFTGVMPSDIGLIPNLVTLELYNNSFHGQIPLSLGRFIASPQSVYRRNSSGNYNRSNPVFELALSGNACVIGQHIFKNQQAIQPSNS